MLRDIPLQRLFAYLVTLGALPFLFLFYSLLGQNNDLNFLQQRLEAVQEMAEAKQSKQSLNRRIRTHYTNADHFYIDQQIEPLSFLAPEVQKLEESLDQQEVGVNDAVQKRLEQLSGTSNKIRFTEGTVLSFEGVQEVTETMVKPVELNMDDVQQILTVVEGVTIPPHTPPDNRPLLLILDFRLERKAVVGDHEVMTLFMKLLKREFS